MSETISKTEAGRLEPPEQLYVLIRNNKIVQVDKKREMSDAAAEQYLNAKYVIYTRADSSRAEQKAFWWAFEHARMNPEDNSIQKAWEAYTAKHRSEHD